jgi:hypothetical protein
VGRAHTLPTRFHVGTLPTGDRGFKSLRLRSLSHIQRRSRRLSGIQLHSRVDLGYWVDRVTWRCVDQPSSCRWRLLTCVPFASRRRRDTAPRYPKLPSAVE